jgi:hypothetical protein
MFEPRIQKSATGTDLAATLPSEAVEALNDRQLREALRGYEQLIGWAQAGQLAVLAEMARREPADDLFVSAMDDPRRFVADEVAAELALSKLAASYRLQLAVDLDAFPATARALCDGCLDLSKVREIVEQLQLMESAEFVSAVESAAIEYGRTHSRPQLRAWLRRRVMAFEPQTAERRRKVAEESRKVAHLPGVDGMSSILADLPAHDAVAVWRLVDQVAQASRFADSHPDTSGGESGTDVADDDRTMDQRRADAFVDLVLGRVPGASKTEVLVTVSAETLVGASEEPGELAGFGPITAEHARELAKDAAWRRLLTDPTTGRGLEAGRDRYRPSEQLSSTVIARDGTCRFPGCRRAAAGCDLDHTVPWPQGRTEESNLAALCRSHHLLKTFGGWTVEQLPDAVMLWTTPTGRVFHTQPVDHRPMAPPGLAA